MFYFLSSLLFALETWINKNLLASQVFATYLWKQDLKKKKKLSDVLTQVDLICPTEK